VVFQSATRRGFRVIAFSPDGSILAGAGDDRIVHLWDMRTGQGIRKLVGHEGPIHSLDFSADGRLLASGSADTTSLLWDVAANIGVQAVVDLAPEQLHSLWQDLAGQDAARAQAAMWRLSAGRQTVRWLGDHLEPVSTVAVTRLAHLVAELDSTAFAAREKATSELEKLAELAAPALRKALATSPSLELRRRIESLLQKHNATPPPDKLRALRAIDVLERIGTGEARQLLEQLARGAPGAKVTMEARDSLDRLQGN
jgi:hypothetical protein